MPLIAPSLLSVDFMNLSKELKALSCVDALHFDVMDGHFVPNLTFGPMILSQIKQHTHLPIDVHLMVKNASSFIEPFVQAGADSLSFHIENTPHIHKDLMHTKKLGKKAGVVINPGTSLSALDGIIPHTDHVIFMSVNPGFGGQAFIVETLDRMRTFKALYPKIPIWIDGGINPDTAKQAIESGADLLIIGNGFFKHPLKDYQKIYEFYKGLPRG